MEAVSANYVITGDGIAPRELRKGSDPMTSTTIILEQNSRGKEPVGGRWYKPAGRCPKRKSVRGVLRQRSKHRYSEGLDKRSDR